MSPLGGPSSFSSYRRSHLRSIQTAISLSYSSVAAGFIEYSAMQFFRAVGWRSSVHFQAAVHCFLLAWLQNYKIALLNDQIRAAPFVTDLSHLLHLRFSGHASSWHTIRHTSGFAPPPPRAGFLDPSFTLPLLSIRMPPNQGWHLCRQKLVFAICWFKLVLTSKNWQKLKTHSKCLHIVASSHPL